MIQTPKKNITKDRYKLGFLDKEAGRKDSLSSL